MPGDVTDLLVFDAPLNQVHAPGDCGEDVVEVVRDACRKLAERFELLTLDQRGLRRFATLDLALKLAIGTNQFARLRPHLHLKIGSVAVLNFAQYQLCLPLLVDIQDHSDHAGAAVVIRRDDTPAIGYWRNLGCPLLTDR
jgi:hypothetical protein